MTTSHNFTCNNKPAERKQHKKPPFHSQMVMYCKIFVGRQKKKKTIYKFLSSSSNIDKVTNYIEVVITKKQKKWNSISASSPQSPHCEPPPPEEVPGGTHAFLFFAEYLSLFLCLVSFSFS